MTGMGAGSDRDAQIAANDQYRDRDAVLWFLWLLFALAWFGTPALVIYLIERPLS